jgi:hypothetical protein
MAKSTWNCTSSKIDCPCGQCMTAHSEGISWVFNVELDGKNSTSTVLTGFGTIWLPSIRRCEEIAQWIRVRYTIWPSFDNWAILSGIEKTTWIHVFRNWMKKLQKCIDTQGEYITSHTN